MRDKHMKDAAQDLAEDVTQDVAEDLLGAAKDGSAKVFIVKVLVYLSHRHLSVAEPTPRLPLGDTLRTGT